MVEDKNNLRQVFEAYGLNEARAATLGNGLINRTWKVSAQEGQYVLQRINGKVFQDPRQIAFNIKQIGAYLLEKEPNYLFTRPVAALSGEEISYVGNSYYRLFLYVRGSHTVDVVNTQGQAYEAAAQFGTFTQKLSGFDATKLQITIPHFHDLDLRYRQFLTALKNACEERRNLAKKVTAALLQKEGIVTVFNSIQGSKDFKQRVTHHDTKISNVLFDEADKGLCVIDLDTVMPGYFISDVGDMLRTYLSPANEEERDFKNIVVRDDFYRAVVQGYVEKMNGELTGAERSHIFYAGEAMIYMQALRFLTDYLNNDSYYGAAYEGHNLMRAGNQLTLLQRLQEKRDVLQAIT